MQNYLVLVLLHAHFLEKYDGAPVLIVWCLLLGLLLLLCLLMELRDLAAKRNQVLLILQITRLVQCGALLLNTTLNIDQLLRDNRLDNEQNFTEANSVFQLVDQVFILLRHILDLLSKLFFYANEVAQLRLQAIHLHVFDLLVLLVELALHFGDLLQSLLLVLCFQISVHVFTINVLRYCVHLFFGWRFDLVIYIACRRCRQLSLLVN